MSFDIFVNTKSPYHKIAQLTLDVGVRRCSQLLRGYYN